jgi:EmrB/QacA subfamily drug resistance transporter
MTASEQRPDSPRRLQGLSTAARAVRADRRRGVPVRLRRSPGEPGRAALALLAGAQFCIVLDVSVVNMALPSMAAALEVAQADLSWAVNAYVLTFGGFLLLGGRLADVFGPIKMFAAGIVVFSAASLAGGMAPSVEWLVAARSVQGLGGAILSPATLAIITRLYAVGAERNKALAIWSAVSALGAPAGAMLGGLLTQSAGWGSVLLINVPVGLVAVLMTPMILPPLRPSASRASFDFAGALAITAGLSSVIYVLVQAREIGWTSVPVLAGLAVGASLVTLFVRIERRARNPLVPPRFMKLPGVTTANGIGIVGSLPLYGMWFYLTIYLQRNLGYSPLVAGVLSLPFGLIFTPCARLASSLLARVSVGRAMGLGLLLLSVSLLLLAAVDGTRASVVTAVIPAQMIAAAGIAVFLVSLNVAALRPASALDAGLASGLVSTSQQLGSALGLAGSVAVYGLAAGSGEIPGLGLDVQALRAVFSVEAAWALVAGVLALVLVSDAPSPARRATTRDQ